jgi:hypothetical protein
MASAVVSALLTLAASSPASEAPVLPARVRRIVLHTLGGPFYGQPEMRWIFFPPDETLRRWKRPTFGAHWIVSPDGSIWPRHPARGEAPSFRPPGSPLSPAFATRLVGQATPVYSHVADRNTSSVGIELSHSGRRDDPFPEVQVRSAAWLVGSLIELSRGRLSARSVVGHKDLDRDPAYVGDRCHRRRCLAYVDAAGRPYRRRVDPPEALFEALAREGLRVPRAASEGDAELARAEAIGRDEVPRTEKP